MRRALILLACASVVLSGPAFAEGRGAGQGKKDGNGGGPTAGEVVVDVITAVERSLILSYIAEHRGDPAFQVKPLPPGIQKNLARGKPLPPGIAKRYLPGSLLSQLPPRPGYEWRILGADVLLVVAATQIVVGILAGAI